MADLKTADMSILAAIMREHMAGSEHGICIKPETLHVIPNLFNSKTTHHFSDTRRRLTEMEQLGYVSKSMQVSDTKDVADTWHALTEKGWDAVLEHEEMIIDKMLQLLDDRLLYFASFTKFPAGKVRGHLQTLLNKIKARKKALQDR